MEKAYYSLKLADQPSLSSCVSPSRTRNDENMFKVFPPSSNRIWCFSFLLLCRGSIFRFCASNPTNVSSFLIQQAATTEREHEKRKIMCNFHTKLRRLVDCFPMEIGGLPLRFHRSIYCQFQNERRISQFNYVFALAIFPPLNSDGCVRS